MAWENRNGRRYYYHKKREGKRVVSQYSGCGDVAEAIAGLLASDRQTRAALREQARRELAQDADLDRLINEAAELAGALTVAALLLAGYHTHKGQWRKRRDGDTATTTRRGDA